MIYTGKKYESYFNIDPRYFPVVDEKIIKQNPEVWKNYFPHDTFKKLLADVEAVLSRNKKLSIWVQGAYGTGKSHAVLTLKKLLDASEDDAKAYFNDYGIDKDFQKKFLKHKTEGKILTVHRYGSSKINGDAQLAFAIQESIDKALKDAGITNSGTGALKDGVLKWLENNANKNYLTQIIEEKSILFGGDSIDDVIQKLQTLDGVALSELMDKLFQVADERQIKVLDIDSEKLCEWIKVVIEKNALKAIVFIWDEFTEFFQSNMGRLTGFQRIVELSASAPFYMVIVTHKGEAMFGENNTEWKKIRDRFVNPICNIELPENMALKLIGQALKKKDDEFIQKEYEQYFISIADRTKSARDELAKKMKLDDKDLVNVLPIHPYSAILLKFISSAFESNQRSMFQFIKDGANGADFKGFQWFIKEYGPDDDKCVLTIDLLWDFFYEKGKDGLSQDVRTVLDCYNNVSNKKLNEKEKRILKTTLLLQAISERTGNTVEALIPTAENIQNSFRGDDEISLVENHLKVLENEKILFKKNIGNGKDIYSAMKNAVDLDELEKYKKEVEKISTTSQLLAEAEFTPEILNLTSDMQLRYDIDIACFENLEITKNKKKNKYVNGELGNKIPLIIAFAKNDVEQNNVTQKIQSYMTDPSLEGFVFVDASITPLGMDAWKQYVDNKAQMKCFAQKDRKQSEQYDRNAKGVLSQWKNRISAGDFYVYSKYDRTGDRIVKIESLQTKLKEIDKREYPDSLECNFDVIDNLWKANSMPQGVELGVKQDILGTYRTSTENKKLDKNLDGAWKVEKYWEKNPTLTISKIKVEVDEYVKERFKNGDRVAIGEIYDLLEQKPFGFMPCNLTAFVLGFVLKEYVDKLSYSDDTASDSLSIQKLKECVAEYLKHKQTENPKYKPKYIVQMSEQMKLFFETTSVAFGISKMYLSSLETARDRIRSEIKKLPFPIVVLKSLPECDNVLSAMIDDYTGIANNNNIGGGSENACALNIGKESKNNKSIAQSLKNLLTKEKSVDAMKLYLQSYDNGSLISLAEKIGDSNCEYLNILRSKFDAESASWLWTEETIRQRIDEVILDYQIVDASNEYLAKNNSIEATLKDWRGQGDRIKVSYAAAKNDLGSVTHIMDSMVEIRQNLNLQISQKKRLLDSIKAEGAAFVEFRNNQVSIFKNVCKSYLDGLTDDNIRAVFDRVPDRVFDDDKPTYLSRIDDIVTLFRQNLGAEKLKALWKEKTGTQSPKEWSSRYSMPILSMMGEKEYDDARSAFDTINDKVSDEKKVNAALKFLSDADFFEKLSDSSARDEAFRNTILKEYSELLDQVEMVKEKLKSDVATEPYNWLRHPEVEKRVKVYAEKTYNQGGFKKAFDKIEKMDAAKVKEYLKNLIKDNMIVGLEIIKE
ncbi:MAG: hypothetical protein SPL52_01210 [Fibrobacter sp.]|nr:hypothetical protein [Fibrobacter sp.]